MDEPGRRVGLIALKCASCAASVDVPTGAARLRCAYCGTSLKVKGAGDHRHTVVPSKAGLYVLAVIVPVLIGFMVMVAGRGDASPELKLENVQAAHVEGAGVRLQATVRVVQDTGDASPYVNVQASCGEHKESQRLLDGELQELEAGNSRSGIVTLLGAKAVDPAEPCEFVLSFEGAVSARDFKYCLRPGGELWKTACK